MSHNPKTYSLLSGILYEEFHYIPLDIFHFKNPGSSRFVIPIGGFFHVKSFTLSYHHLFSRYLVHRMLPRHFTVSMRVAVEEADVQIKLINWSVYALRGDSCMLKLLFKASGRSR